MIDTLSARAQLQDLVDDQVAGAPVPGFAAAIWWDGQSFEIASGTANRNTGAPMTADTAFLAGSITKVLMTTILMRFVERGLVSLDDRVVDRLPELRLGDQDTLDALKVVNLVNHTSGIDAADFCPELGRGDDAVRKYVALLADKGQLYPLGDHISYCNAAFVILGRMFEVLTGDDFHTILRREIYGPVGMERSTTSGDEAILHRTAIGHIVDAETSEPRPTRRFMLPYSMAPAGTTVIATVGDLLRFARVHLGGGLTADGTRLIAAESAEAMRTPTIREEQLGGFAVGMGWLLPPYGAVRITTHSGGSFGGHASLVVVPEKKFAFAAFGNSTSAAPVHQRIEDFVLQDMLGLAPPPAVEPTDGPIDPARYTGTFVRQFHRVRISAGDNDELVSATKPEYDADHLALMSGYVPSIEPPPVRLRAASPTLFVPAEGTDEPVTVNRITGAGPSFLDLDETGRFSYLVEGLRISRRVS